ncbi:MAG: asparagine synthetase B [FCB group bacterium]|nr:asparagine synthetase B [FCB group bacterium]
MLLFLAGLFSIVTGQKLLIPMDLTQTDHLKAYGVAYWTLKQGRNVDWLLNYRGGAFMMDDSQNLERECKVRGISFELVNAAQLGAIYGEIEANNMDDVLLEKAPKIAVYSPPEMQPWDDAVTLALTYAEIDYETVFDDEVLADKLNDYDWLHLHHEDFTGQYGKFYRNYHGAAWYQNQVADFERIARRHGFATVQELKKAVAAKIRDFTVNGGFLFAMCSATDSFDIALATQKTDIAASVYDGSPVDPDYRSKIDYSKSFAFENYSLYTDPMVYEYSTIDIPPSNKPVTRSAEADYFTLFEFSAKLDPVPTMLTQDHVGVINGFMGQTTAFNRNYLKKSVVILGEVENDLMVKYIHGNEGKGSFTFLGGHDPEDYRHFVGDPPTDLSLHRNSPGYRLILNNVLFPAARKKEKKT